MPKQGLERKNFDNRDCPQKIDIFKGALKFPKKPQEAEIWRKRPLFSRATKKPIPFRRNAEKGDCERRRLPIPPPAYCGENRRTFYRRESESFSAHIERVTDGCGLSWVPSATRPRERDVRVLRPTPAFRASFACNAFPRKAHRAYSGEPA